MSFRRSFSLFLPPALTVCALVLVWQFAASRHWVSERALSSPSAIWQAIVENWPSLWQATRITAWEGLAGFLISVGVGVAIGIALYCSKPVNRAVSPLLLSAQTLPLIAIAPLFVMWFGFEPVGKIVLVAVFSTFAIAVQTARGLAAVPRFYEDVALTCGASKAWTLFHVKLRVAARHIFGGMRISAAYVFGTAVTAEYLGAVDGLGIWLQAAFNSFRTPLIFAAAVMTIALTAVLFMAIALIEWALLGQAKEDTLDDSPIGAP